MDDEHGTVIILGAWLINSTLPKQIIAVRLNEDDKWNQCGLTWRLNWKLSEEYLYNWWRQVIELGMQCREYKEFETLTESLLIFSLSFEVGALYLLNKRN
jgi:hypothetical protein